MDSFQLRGINVIQTFHGQGKVFAVPYGILHSSVYDRLYSMECLHSKLTFSQANTRVHHWDNEQESFKNATRVFYKSATRVDKSLPQECDKSAKRLSHKNETRVSHKSAKRLSHKSATGVFTRVRQECPTRV